MGLPFFFIIMKILVGSVFIDHERSEFWYRTQIEYLRKTTPDFQHVVYLNGYNTTYIDKSVILGQQRSLPEACQDHVRGLTVLLEYFIERIYEYDYFLLLDSDCFPISYNWASMLENALLEVDMPIAAVVRYENLDNFAHPCAFFMNRQGLEQTKFAIRFRKNLISQDLEDVYSNVETFFPLLRTNVVNKHPLLGGIYWDCFYHHGAGSRSLCFRAIDSGYYYRGNLTQLELSMFDSLKSNTERYLWELSGGRINLGIKML